MQSIEMKLKILLLSAAVIGVVFSEELPAGFKRCSSKNTACLREAIENALPQLANGIKELGVPNLDPLRLSKLTVGSGNIIQLVQNYEKVDVTGLSQTKITDLSFDLDRGKVSFGTLIPKLEFKGSYTVKGKILVLDVYGKGTCSVTFRNIKGTIDMDVQKYQKNGETYLKVTNMVFGAEPANVHYQFDNLFDGNKQLGDNINNVLNDNWKEIFDEVKSDYLNAVAKYSMRLSNKLFEKIPLKYIFLD